MIQLSLSLKKLFSAPVLVLSITALSASALHSATTCDPRTFGGKGDGVTKDTAAIQQAIDACSPKFGGTVELTAGTYLSGPIVLKSNITLQLDKGATLLGSSDQATIRRSQVPPARPAAAGERDQRNQCRDYRRRHDRRQWRDLVADGAQLRGSGVLGDHPRPKLIIFDHCKHVRVEGVTVQNSPMWQLFRTTPTMW